MINTQEDILNASMARLRSGRTWEKLKKNLLGLSFSNVFSFFFDEHIKIADLFRVVAFRIPSVLLKFALCQISVAEITL